MVKPCSFFHVQRSKTPQLVESFMTEHEFLLRKDFMFLSLWQCVPYSPLLTASSDPVLFSVYFWDQTVFWSGGLSFFPVCQGCRRRWPRGFSCSLFPNLQIPPSVIETRGSEKAMLCSHLASAGSLNNWKCLCSSLHSWGHLCSGSSPIFLWGPSCWISERWPVLILGHPQRFFGIWGQI